MAVPRGASMTPYTHTTPTRGGHGGGGAGNAQAVARAHVNTTVESVDSADLITVAKVSTESVSESSVKASLHQVILCLSGRALALFMQHVGRVC